MKVIHNEPSRLKVGIWCNYHITLEPSEGIGVFAHNLARGLAKLPNGPDVVLCIRPGDEPVVAETLAAGQGRISTISPDTPNFTQRSIRRIRRFLQRQQPAPLPPGNDKRAARPMLRLWQITARSLEKLLQPCDMRYYRTAIASCDVWLLPFAGIDIEFRKPTIAVIHDLVPFHFPGVLPPRALQKLGRQMTRTAQQCTFATCMSQFIRKNDLEGLLHLPAEKVRVVPPAAPRDFTPVKDIAATKRRYPLLDQKYLFYPAAFRAYKNHELLVEALHALQQLGEEPPELVFTGICEPPESLKRLISQHHLQSKVHVLGKVERDVLAAFYQNALATIVPSRYEQGSFPIMEAIHWKCPVACARIPSLTELFEPMGEAMLFFDPDHALELARLIQHLARERAAILERQQAAAIAMFQRTWTDAAADWMRLFEEAAAPPAIHTVPLRPHRRRSA